MSDNACTMEMPKYKCHKKVWALQIEKVDGKILHFVRKEYQPAAMKHSFIVKHEPKAGGYLVVYEDGYKSFSPKNVFEDGYTPE